MQPKQLEFLEWCFNRGAAKKMEKVDARKAQLLMELHGTVAGAVKFAGDAFWAATPSGEGTFLASELLDHFRIRPWFSTQLSKQAFQAQIAKAREKGQAEDDSDSDGVDEAE